MSEKEFENRIDEMTDDALDQIIRAAFENEDRAELTHMTLADGTEYQFSDGFEDRIQLLIDAVDYLAAANVITLEAEPEHAEGDDSETLKAQNYHKTHILTLNTEKAARKKRLRTLMSVASIGVVLFLGTLARITFPRLGMGSSRVYEEAAEAEFDVCEELSEAAAVAEEAAEYAVVTEDFCEEEVAAEECIEAPCAAVSEEVPCPEDAGFTYDAALGYTGASNRSAVAGKAANAVTEEKDEVLSGAMTDGAIAECAEDEEALDVWYVIRNSTSARIELPDGRSVDIEGDAEESSAITKDDVDGKLDEIKAFADLDLMEAPMEPADSPEDWIYRITFSTVDRLAAEEWAQDIIAEEVVVSFHAQYVQIGTEYYLTPDGVSFENILDFAEEIFAAYL